jgi:hypothetical protein
MLATRKSDGPAERHEMTVTRTHTDLGRERLIDQLRELIRALDSRAPHLEREGETQIADDAAALKQKAIDRIAQLER